MIADKQHVCAADALSLDAEAENALPETGLPAARIDNA